MKALTLRGIFMLRRSELLWFYQEGASHIFPDAWEGFLAPIPPRERGDLMTAYYKRLTSRNRAVRKEAAKAWSVWEGTTSKLFTDPAVIKRFGGGRFADAFARIEAHYFVNKGLFEHDDQLLRNVHRLRKDFRRSSCRGATTWSARPLRLGICTGRGPKRNSSWCPMPAIR